jgi:hypothetical protein
VTDVTPCFLYLLLERRHVWIAICFFGPSLCPTENTVSTRRITERGIYAKCMLISPILTGIEIMRQCLVDIPDVDLHENPSFVSLIVP